MTNPGTSSLRYVYFANNPLYPNLPGCMKLIHTISQYQHETGRLPSMWDNWSFGWIGDVVGGQVPDIGEFSGNLFQLSINGNLIDIPQPYLLQA
jgi:hypothetical protein